MAFYTINFAQSKRNLLHLQNKDTDNTTTMDTQKPDTMQSRYARMRARIMQCWDYCCSGVWSDTRNDWKVNVVKTINLSVRSFLDRDLQSQACALTYRTLLALVPVLALLLAIARGFGLQHLLETELIGYFPSQETVLRTAFGFVDSYLEQASGGLFVGIGLIFLLWTLISLLSSVENAFNNIWQVSKGRSMWRKITDYVAIILILPILMICASGLSIFMSDSLRSFISADIIEPAITFLLDCATIVLTWIFFAGSYMLIPNTKVKPVNALISGIIVGTAYQVLQWLFVSGQLYVSKYNAIYGSFSFLPLLLIWMQLVWLITLIGGVLCYAAQNIGEYNFGDKIKQISQSYYRQAALAVMVIIVRRFERGATSLTPHEIAHQYGLPINLVVPIITQLHGIGLINSVYTSNRSCESAPVQPSKDVSTLTVDEFMSMLDNDGEAEFIPNFGERYNKIRLLHQNVTTRTSIGDATTKLIDIDID